MGQDEIMRRVFMRVDDPTTLLQDLGEGSAFVPTRLSFRLGECVTLSLRLGPRGRTLDLPVVVLGRRPARGDLARLSAGVQVRLKDAQHPVAILLRELAEGRVVDFEARLQEHAFIPVSSRFHDRDDLLREISFLTHGGEATVPVDVPVHVKDRLRLSLGSIGLLSLPPVLVETRGVILRDEERLVRVCLVHEEDGIALLAALERRRIKQTAG